MPSNYSALYVRRAKRSSTSLVRPICPSVCESEPLTQAHLRYYPICKTNLQVSRRSLSSRFEITSSSKYSTMRPCQTWTTKSSYSSSSSTTRKSAWTTSHLWPICEYWTSAVLAWKRKSGKRRKQMVVVALAISWPHRAASTWWWWVSRFRLVIAQPRVVIWRSSHRSAILVPIRKQCQMGP